MKKYSILALTLVLTAALFTGCGCRNRNVGRDTVPTVMPTTNATSEPTHVTTEPATVPTTEHTNPSTDATIDHGNGHLEEPTATDGTAEGRARHVVPNGR